LALDVHDDAILYFQCHSEMETCTAEVVPDTRLRCSEAPEAVHDNFAISILLVSG
jgi:hypothetical protein